MPQMQFPKILAFVEGTMERLFINNNFPYVQLVPVSNGVSWTSTAMARQIQTLYKAKNFHGDAIVVWIDREKREHSSAELSEIIRTALIQAGAPPQQIHLLVPDMMSENIILSDEILIRTHFDCIDYVYDYEGSNGKSILKSLFLERGERYAETTSGVSLLKKVRLSNCRESSPSIDQFLNTFTHNCWWTSPADATAAL